MEGQAASRPRELILGGAVATCLVLACVFIGGGGTAVGSAATAAAATDPPPPPTTTITVIKTSFTEVIVPVTETNTTYRTVTFSTTATKYTTKTGNPPSVTLTLPPTTLPDGTITKTSRNLYTTAPRKSSGLTVITETRPGPTVTKPNPTITVRTVASPPTNRLRLAAGAAGLAVTSAAGFGFLLLRRRARYGL